METGCWTKNTVCKHTCYCFMSGCCLLCCYHMFVIVDVYWLFMLKEHVNYCWLSFIILIKFIRRDVVMRHSNCALQKRVLRVHNSASYITLQQLNAYTWSIRLVCNIHICNSCVQFTLRVHIFLTNFLHLSVTLSDWVALIHAE